MRLSFISLAAVHTELTSCYYTSVQFKTLSNIDVFHYLGEFSNVYVQSRQIIVIIVLVYYVFDVKQRYCIFIIIIVLCTCSIMS